MKNIIPLLALLLFEVPCWAVKPVQIVTRSLSNGQNGVAYSITLRAKFGTKPYAWTQPSGTLPTGLSLAGATGIISGTPSANGTFNFVITVTDSAGSPTTDSKSFKITIAGTAPVTPVSITTTSLPDGTNGVAYSALLHAANGTAPYTWSLPSGALPPGVTLTAATGAISGTPTAQGSYGFTARVTDANSATYDRAFVISIAEGMPTYLFSDDFESGNLSAWTFSWAPGNPSVQSSVKHGGTYAAQIHYTICGDSTDSACGSSHQDQNYFMQKQYDTSSLSEVFVRGYFRVKTPEAGASLKIGRKLFYFFSDPGANPTGWSIFFDVTDNTVSMPGAGPLRLRWSLQSGQIGGGTFVVDCGTSPNPVTGIGCALQYDTWYSLEVRLKYNTLVGPPWDGEVQIWIDGASVYNISGWSLNRTSGLKLQLFRVGAQVDRDVYRAVDEYRYWDDVVINNSYVGP